ncbi:MAG: molybdopterin molybdotransferase MoeA [Crenarchaeota archaeon]|nr:molybdopterin molybdotransferase MoeA [Thermoproteota archaeon]
MRYRFASLSEAIESVASRARVSLGVEKLCVDSAVSRVCARDYESPIDVPPAPSSAVDGYAVRSVDTFGASRSSPIELALGSECREGVASRVFTGDRLPPGCDAVVMMEDAEDLGDRVLIYRAVPSYANVRRAGEDIRRGEVIARRGVVLRPWHVAALAACGFSDVEVFERLRIGVLVVGSEVREPSYGVEAYSKGLVLNSSGPLVLAALRELGFVEATYLGIARDDPREIASMVSRALENAHAVVTVGGTGPSSRDVTARAIEALGGEVVVRGIAIRPGRPTSAAVVDGKPVFMLSGFPVAAFVGLTYFALPALARALGIELQMHRCVAELRRRLPSSSGYTCFARARARIEGRKLAVEPLAIRGSGNISTLLRGNAIIVVPEGVEGFEEGDDVVIDLL